MSKRVYNGKATVIDNLTGELLASQSKSLVFNGKSEKFIMVTTTNGIGWIKELNSYLGFLIVLVSEYSKDDIISLTPARKAEISALFEWKNAKHIDLVLYKLLKVDAIRRVGRGDYMVNPETIFAGGTIKKIDKINKYIKLK